MGKWFKFYSETLHSREITRVSLRANQPKAVVIGVWATLLSLADSCSETGEILASQDTPLTLGEIIWVLGIDQESAVKILEQFISLNLLEERDGVFIIADWDRYKAPPKDNYDRLRAEIYERDRECVYCGGNPEHLDHIKPQIRGGLSVPGNLVAACARCNQSKNDSDVTNWYKRQSFFNPLRLERIIQIMNG